VNVIARPLLVVAYPSAAFLSLGVSVENDCTGDDIADLLITDVVIS
jgi:hypothetical protein